LPRERDYSFEALVEVTGADMQALTQNERGRINKALKELRELNADDYLLADEIHAKAKAWATAYPEIQLTPQALTGQWSSIEKKAADTRRSQIRVVNAPSPPGAGGCICNGDKMVLVGTTADGHEQYAPCPECNSSADADFWRADGSRHRSLDPGLVRERMNQ